MKKNSLQWTLALSFALATGGLNLATASQAAAQPVLPPEVVPSLDVEQYMGTWYEVASNRPGFQADCFCTTAQYTLGQQNGTPTVAVRNSCNRGSASGPLTTIDGSASIPNANEPAKLSVQFGPSAPPFTNYWIVALAQDYSWAVVSSAVRKPLYILARDRALAQDTIDTILADLTARDFDTSILDFTVQNGCGR